MLLSALLAAISQLLLKLSAGKSHQKKIFEYLNIYVILGYGLLLLTMLANTWAYQVVEYKIGPVINSFSYIFVMILGRLFLKEKITTRKLVGVCLIALGICVSTLAGGV